YTEKLLLDYRFMDAHNITPRYEYGFGQSYVLGLSISSAGTSQVVSFTVTNTGAVAEIEKPQL
ncbi:hypothetical protein DFH09DRAFT_932742, partial [Mycena vulgaris]